MRRTKAIGLSVVLSFAIVAILAALLLPPLARAKAKRAAYTSNTIHIGLAFRHAHNVLSAPFIISGAIAAPTIQAQDRGR